MRRPPLKLLLSALAAAAAAGVVVVAIGGDGDEGAGEGGRAAGPPARTAPDDRERGEERAVRGGEEGRPAAADGRLDGTVPGRQGRLIVGMGDQKLDLFGDPRFLRLGIRHVRLTVPWNAALAGDGSVDAWLERARAGGFEVLVAFGHAPGSRCPDEPCRAPSVERFERAFAAFRERWPWVDAFSTWNEPNHASQPVADRPELVAGYHRAIRRRCRGCTVVAADVVGDGSAPRWVRGFRRAAGRASRLWGLHNYPDTNRFRSSGTEAFLDLVDGDVWITETGGVVQFTTASGRPALPYDEGRAARATRHMFRLARSDPRIERLYVYHWNIDPPAGRFDAGLIGLDGEPRPAYDVLRDELRR